MSDIDPSAGREPARRKFRRWAWRALLALGIIVALAGLSLAAFRLSRSGVLPGIEVAGVDVGTLGAEELREVLADLQIERGEREVTVTRSSGGGAAVTSATTRSEMGLTLDVAATADELLDRGRQGNPLAALADHLRATFGGFEQGAVSDLDEGAFGGWLEATAEELAEPPFPGGIAFDGLEPRGLPPEQGIAVDEEQLRGLALSVIRSGREDRIEVDALVVPPPTDRDDVAQLVEEARTAVSAPITLRHGLEELVLQPQDLAGLLTASTRGEGPGTELRLAADPKALRGLVESPERFASPPVDASFEVVGDDGVRIVPSQPGFSFSARRAAKQIPKVALSEDRDAALRGKEVEAAFTRSDAQELNITERVSTFTTYHSCCEPRVSNIHTIADIVDGAIVEPGETFSLNDFVGPRTTAAGFVPAPSIRDGEFVAEVGGGISQFATTFFNAIFFGGYDFLEYKAHSYYISRYPRGREATISTPSPDLAFLNDSEAGIYIDTSYTETSITVSFFGTSEYEIEAIMGEPFNPRPPPEQCRANKELAKGEERVVQSGISGFDVVVKRVFEPGGREEEFFTRYLAQPRIVERKRCPKGTEGEN